MNNTAYGWVVKADYEPDIFIYRFDFYPSVLVPGILMDLYTLAI